MSRTQDHRSTQAWKKKWKRCKAWTKGRHRCKGKALPGKEFCLAHERVQKIKEKREARAPKAGGPEAFLHPVERESYNDLVAQLAREIRPKSVGDSILLERFATAVVQARRCDVASKEGQKGASKDVYYADLRVMNLATKLGIARNFRLRREEGTGRTAEVLKKWGWLFKGERKALELDRGHGQAATDTSGVDKGRPRGVLPSNPQDRTSRQAEDIPEGPESIQERAMGEEGGEEHG